MQHLITIVGIIAYGKGNAIYLSEWLLREWATASLTITHKEWVTDQNFKKISSPEILKKLLE